MSKIITKFAYFLPKRFPKNAKFSKNRSPFTPENALSIEIANFLKEMTLTGKLKCVWTKIAHEQSSSSITYGVLMNNMGKNAGAADFIFTGQHKSLWVELKSDKGELSPNQLFFQNWCIEQKVVYVVVTTLKDLIAYLSNLQLLESPYR